MPTSSAAAHDPAAIVQAQLDAYNAHDIEALVAIYAGDAEQFQHPSTLLAKGSEQIRARFAARFAASTPHATLLHRIVVGKMVIDHETVSGVLADGTSGTDLVATYEVDGVRISRAWFILGETRLEQAA